MSFAFGNFFIDVITILIISAIFLTLGAEIDVNTGDELQELEEPVGLVQTPNDGGAEEEDDEVTRRKGQSRHKFCPGFTSMCFHCFATRSIEDNFLNDVLS